MSAQTLQSASHDTKPVLPSVIIIAENTRSASSCIEGISGLAPDAKMLGVYAHNFADREIMLVNSSSLAQPLPSGVYVVIPVKVPPPGSKPVVIGNVDYNLVVRDGINFLGYKI